MDIKKNNVFITEVNNDGDGNVQFLLYVTTNTEDSEVLKLDRVEVCLTVSLYKQVHGSYSEITDPTPPCTFSIFNL